jgi:hypothetical protein
MRFDSPLAGEFFRLAGVILLGLGCTNLGWAQAQLQVPQVAQPAQSPIPAMAAQSPASSQVFPDGGFPATPRAPEGGFPAPAAQLLAPKADYAPPGLQPREMQEGPGVPEFYRPIEAPLPDYYYQPSYYDSPGIGARPLADYAPPGYIEREFQDAPGVPEFSPITAPVPLTPAELQKFVGRGMMPGSFLVPGTATSFRLRGFVRLTGLYDLNPIGSRDDFVTNTIPIPKQVGQNNNLSARPSRIGFETWTPTTIFDWNVHTFIEADFFNGPAQAVGGGGNPFRLRFAFVDFGYFRIGQQNTVFMDSSAFPSTVDFAGPRGLDNLRRPSIRATIPLADKLYWAVGVEQPFSDITTNGLGDNVQDVPDFATHLRYETDYGSLQLSSVLRTIEYRPTDEAVTRQEAWGVSASTVFHPWAILCGSSPLRKDNPSGLERSRILLQYSCGYGIARYLQDTSGLGLDAQVDPANGSFETLWTTGWSASYEHWWTEKWLTNLTYSGVQVGNNGDQPGSTYRGAKYLAASLWYIPIRNMSIGIEFVWGERENLDGQHAPANRVNALFQYNF